MSPLTARPIPRFIADSTREALPYGRWSQQLREEFVRACEEYESEAGAPGEIVWYPERGWGERVYVPATAPASGPDGGPLEYFGYVSFDRPEGEDEPSGLRAVADFTDVTAEQNPDWKIDLNEEVIGAWRGEADRSGAVTLVWGTPLVPGATAVTAELDGEAVDQAPITDDRFTLIGVDDLRGFGDTMYLEVRLWSKQARELASETLYDEPE